MMIVFNCSIFPRGQWIVHVKRFKTLGGPIADLGLSCLCAGDKDLLLFGGQFQQIREATLPETSLDCLGLAVLLPFGTGMYRKI